MPSTNQEPDQKRQRTFTLRLDLKNVAAIVVLVAILNLIIQQFDKVVEGLAFLGDVLSPFAYGLMLAYLLNLIMVRWEKVWFPNATEGLKARSRRPMCIVLSFLTVIALFVIIFFMVADEIMNALGSLWSSLNSVFDLFGFDLESVFESITGSGTEDIIDTIETIVTTIMGGTISSAITEIAEAGGEVIGAITDAFIIIAFAIYLLSAKERSLAALNRIGRLFLNERTYAITCHVCHTANENMSKFFYGQFMEGIVLGTLCGIGMAILQLPYAATVGFCVGVGALVPIVGAWAAGIIGFLIILPVSFKQAVIFVIYLLILQQFDGQFIYPKVVGNAVGVSSIWVLVSVFVGGGLFGVAGMLAGVPAAATIITLCQEWADIKEGKRENPWPREDEEGGAGGGEPLPVAATAGGASGAAAAAVPAAETTTQPVAAAATAPATTATQPVAATAPTDAPREEPTGPEAPHEAPGTEPVAAGSAASEEAPADIEQQ